MPRIDYTRKPRTTVADCRHHAFIERCKAAHAALVAAGMARGVASTTGASSIPCTCSTR